MFAKLHPHFALELKIDMNLELKKNPTLNFFVNILT
jgi:hypothetical protein